MHKIMLVIKMPVSVIRVSSISYAQRADVPHELVKCIKPFLFCLRITGLHLFNWKKEDETVSLRIKECLGRLYMGVVPFLLLVNFVISLGQFASFTTFDGPFLNNVISSTWFLQVTCFSLNNLKRNSQWKTVYETWDKYAERYNVNTWTQTRRLSITFTVLYILWFVLATGFLVWSTSSPAPPSGIMAQVPASVATMFTVVVFIAYFFFISTWFLLTGQYSMISILICRALNLHCHEIKSAKAENVLENIEFHRQQHDKLCSLISVADGIVSTFVLVTMFTTIPLIVLTLYFVLFISVETTSFSYVATWWSISLSTIQLAIIFIAGGAVNFSVRGYWIQLKRLGELALSGL